MSSWVAYQNLQDFRRKLAQETDPDKRRILERLIAKEEAILRASGRGHKSGEQ